jgi:hypothetical protein
MHIFLDSNIHLATCLVVLLRAVSCEICPLSTETCSSSNHTTQKGRETLLLKFPYHLTALYYIKPSLIYICFVAFIEKMFKWV